MAELNELLTEKNEVEKIAFWERLQIRRVDMIRSRYDGEKSESNV